MNIGWCGRLKKSSFNRRLINGEAIEEVTSTHEVHRRANTALTALVPKTGKTEKKKFKERTKGY